MSEFQGSSTTFQVRAESYISATPEEVYATVSDLARSGEWSPECTGGTWVSGEPARVGSVFHGDNTRGKDVVAWAPVIRGPWTTIAEVVAAEPGRRFSWVICNSAGEKQDSTWTYELKPAEGGCILVHHYRLGRLTEGLAKIFEGLPEEKRQRFVKEWNAKLADDVAATLARIKVVIEKDAGKS